MMIKNKLDVASGYPMLGQATGSRLGLGSPIVGTNKVGGAAINHPQSHGVASLSHSN